MRGRFFRGFLDYWEGVWRSMRSLGRSVWVGLQYLQVRSESRKEVTEQYPDPVSARSPEELPPRTRGRLINDILKCTGCGDCLPACPTQCIELSTDEGPKPGKKWITKFNVDHSGCVFCGLCVDVCAPQSLVHSREHQAPSASLDGQVSEQGRGPVSSSLRELWEKQLKDQGMGGGF